MREFFVVANSFAAPFFSDISETFVKGPSPIKALEKFVKGYDHPAKLYAAMIYQDANAYHKKKKPIASWVCNHELKKMEVTKNLSSYSFRGEGPGVFSVDGVQYTVDDPYGGKVIQD